VIERGRERKKRERKKERKRERERERERESERDVSPVVACAFPVIACVFPVVFMQIGSYIAAGMLPGVNHMRVFVRHERWAR
jgi:Ni/Co efflux regulator RcnB